MLPEILRRVKNAGYVIFENGVHNANIIGVRSASREAGKFDDKMYFVAKNSAGQWYTHCFEVTTDAGLYWMHNPARVAGTAILCAGQYRSTYKIDKHRGKYDALCQRLAKVQCYRDANRDNIIDMDAETIASGMYGINIHKAASYSTNVGKYSAGCQVFAYSKEYDVFMALCKLSADIWGNAFTYTLLEE